MNLKFWQKRTLENPNTPLCSETADAILTGPGASGQSVTPETAMMYTAVYAAVRLLSETVAQLPLVLYQQKGDTRKPAVDHPLHNLLHNNPSDKLTSFTWRETQMSHTLLQGNGYAYISRAKLNNVARPKELHIIAPHACQPVMDNATGDLSYLITINGEQYRAAPDEILHIPALGSDGVVGKSPITLHRETLGLSMAANEFGSQFFGNGTNWGGVIKHPNTLGKQAKQNLKTGLDRFKGQGYSGLLVLDEGMDYQRIGIPPEDAQFLETRRFQISEVARMYNVPNHMLNDMEKSSFNNISELSISFLRYTMSPWLVKWEQELNRKLLTDVERKSGYYIKFNPGGLLRGTQKERYESYGMAIRDGWLNRNEARELEDRDPVSGLDDYLVPLNMSTDKAMDAAAEQSGQPPEPEPQKEDERKLDFGPLIARSAESFGAWLADVDKRATSDEDRGKRLAHKLGAMTERYVSPVFLAAGIPDGIQRWHDWLESQPADSLPTAEAIEAELTEIIGEHHGA